MDQRRQNLPLNALRAFEATARLGRLTAAATELGVTHGAVSRQVKQLEAFLQLELVAGSRARPHLTEAGAALAEALTSALDRIDGAVRALRAEAEGVLQVGCLSSFAVRWLIPRLHRFAAAHPGIEVRLATAAEKAGPSRGRVDLSITVIDNSEVLGEADRLLFRERIGVVVAASLMGKGTTAKTLRFRKLVAETRADAWAQWERLAGPRTRIAATGRPIRFEHYHFAIQAALGGLGACVVPWHLVADDVAAGHLAAMHPFRETGYRYIVRGIRSRDRKAAHFINWLERELATMPSAPECGRNRARSRAPFR